MELDLKSQKTLDHMRGIVEEALCDDNSHVGFVFDKEFNDYPMATCVLRGDSPEERMKRMRERGVSRVDVILVDLNEPMEPQIQEGLEKFKNICKEAGLKW